MEFAHMQPRDRSAKLKAKRTREEEIRTGVSSGFKGSVANLSLGGGKSRTLDAAINNAVDGGLHVVVAAGNDNKDACNFSPAAAANAITVGASTLQDGRAYFSNWGSCVDVFAPGLNVLSTWTGTPHATNTISGTSMASPRMCSICWLHFRTSLTLVASARIQMSQGSSPTSCLFTDIRRSPRASRLMSIVSCH